MQHQPPRNVLRKTGADGPHRAATAPGPKIPEDTNLGVTNPGDMSREAMNPGDMKRHRARKALAVPAAAVVIMPRHSRTGTSSRARRAVPERARPVKPKAFKPAASCMPGSG